MCFLKKSLYVCIFRYENDAKRKISFSTPVPEKKRATATDEEDVWIATPLLSTPLREIYTENQSQPVLPQTPHDYLPHVVLPETPVQPDSLMSPPLLEQYEPFQTPATGLKRPMSACEREMLYEEMDNLRKEKQSLKEEVDQLKKNSGQCETFFTDY